MQDSGSYSASRNLSRFEMIKFAGGESAVVTFAPIRHSERVAFAAIGLTSMLNCGGAVLDCQLRQEASTNGRDSGKNGTASSTTGKYY